MMSRLPQCNHDQPAHAHVPSRRLSTICLSAHNRNLLEEFIEEWGYRSTFREYGFNVPRTLLFTGPPGTGKTVTAEAIACELGVPFEVVDYTQIVHRYVGETPKAIASQFDRENGVVLFDECDTLLQGRNFNGPDGGGAVHARNQGVNQVLKCLDQQHTELITIFASNAPLAALDHALMRRMALKIEFTQPSAEENRWMLTKLTERYPLIPEAVILEAAGDYPSFAECEMEAIRRCRQWLLNKIRGEKRRRKRHA